MRISTALRGSGGAAGLLLLLLALLLLLPPSASARRQMGIDVSRFQGKIQWSKVAATRVEFVYAQASRGSGRDCAVVPDRCGGDWYYERNYRRARKRGLRVGAYHRAFADGETRRQARRDARAEAAVFLEKVGRLRRGDLLPALDVETPFGSLDDRGLRAWIRTWLRRVENELGAKPVIYTNNSSWQATGNVDSFALDGHPLWVANFDVPRPLVPAGNWGGLGWTIWQYTSSGSVDGIRGPVDENRLRGGFAAISPRGLPVPAQAE